MSKSKQETKTGVVDKGVLKQDFYTVELAAKKLGLAEATVRKYSSAGKIKAYKQAGRLYILHSDLITFITGK